MIKIPSNITEKDKNDFLNKVYPLYEKALLNGTKAEYKILRSYLSVGGKLDKNKLEKMILGDINELKTIARYMKAFNCDPSQMESFKNLYNNHRSDLFFKEWPDRIGINTCPYCNRSYIFTIKEKSIRPEYDHFLPIALYPYFSLCLYNLIPSCSTCNNRKRTTDTLNGNETIIYPFLEEFGNEVVFSAKRKGGTFSDIIGIDSDVDIVIKSSDSKKELTQPQNNSIEILGLDVLYQKHADYAKNLRNAAMIYTDEYMVSLLTNYPWLKSIKNVRELVYFNHLNKEDWHKRILSKFSHDLTEQFKEYKI